MPLTPFDVSNLNRSMEGMGESFAKNRAEKERQEHDIARELLERKMAENSERRLSAEQSREDLLAQGNVDTYLHTDDGEGVIHFHGPQKGLQSLIDGALQKGKKLTPMAEPPQKQPFATIETQTPIGTLKFHAQTADDLGKITEQVQKMGGKPAGQNAPTFGPIAADREATKLEQEASLMEDPIEAGKLSDRAKALRSNVARQAPTGLQPTEEVTEETDPLTQQPKRKVTRKGPVGSITGTNAPGASAGSGNAAALRQQAQDAISKGKDPAAVKQRFKQLTGQDL